MKLLTDDKMQAIKLSDYPIKDKYDLERAIAQAQLEANLKSLQAEREAIVQEIESLISRNIVDLAVYARIKKDYTKNLKQQILSGKFNREQSC